MWVKDESLSQLAMLQVHKHKGVDTDSVVTGAPNDNFW